MKTKSKKSFAGIAIQAAVFYFTLAGLCQGAQAPADVRFRLVHDTVVVVSMTANGQGPFDFVLDTGTNTTVVDTGLAQRLSLPVKDAIQLSTVGGSRMLERSAMPSLTLGTAHVENAEVLIEDLSEFRKLDSRIQGVVGQNFFSHFNYVLDYQHRTIRFEEATEIRDALSGERVAIDRTDDRMVLASTIQSRERGLVHFLLDSGANSVVVFQKASRLVDVPPAFGGQDLQADGSRTQARVGEIRQLSIGSTNLRDLAVALPPSAAADNERPEDGLLPTALFHALYVNNLEGFVIFNPRISR